MNILTCVFDNPITLRRETYNNGNLIGYIKLELLNCALDDRHFIQGYTAYGKFMGDVVVGGDRRHLPESVKILNRSNDDG